MPGSKGSGMAGVKRIGPNRVDVELNKLGHVVSVWYGCLALPYSECIVNAERAGEMRRMYEDMNKRIEKGEFDPIGIFTHLHDQSEPPATLARPPYTPPS